MAALIGAKIIGISNENIKNAMLIKGGNANSTVTQVLRDVVRIFMYIHTF